MYQDLNFRHNKRGYKATATWLIYYPSRQRTSNRICVTASNIFTQTDARSVQWKRLEGQSHLFNLLNFYTVNIQQNLCYSLIYYPNRCSLSWITIKDLRSFNKNSQPTAKVYGKLTSKSTNNMALSSNTVTFYGHDLFVQNLLNICVMRHILVYSILHQQMKLIERNQSLYT